MHKKNRWKCGTSATKENIRFLHSLANKTVVQLRRKFTTGSIVFYWSIFGTFVGGMIHHPIFFRFVFLREPRGGCEAANGSCSTVLLLTLWIFVTVTLRMGGYCTCYPRCLFNRNSFAISLALAEECALPSATPILSVCLSVSGIT